MLRLLNLLPAGVTHFVAKLLVATFFVAAFVACESPSDNSIEEARQCSDKASQQAFAGNAAAGTMAASCAAMLNGVTGAEANQILFGDYLIEDNLVTNIAQAASAQTTNTGGVDSINSVLLVLVDTATPGHLPAMINAANGSNSPGMVYVVNLINMATTLNALATLTTPGNVQSTIATCGNGSNPTCASSVQSAFTTMQTAACTNNTSPTLCTQAGAVTALAVSTYGANYTPSQFVAALATYANSPH